MKEKINELLKAYGSHYSEFVNHPTESEALINKVANTFADRISALFPRWVSAEERLPEAEEDKLLLTKHGIEPGYLVNNGFWVNGSMYNLDYVACWMDLPELPKE